MKPILFNTEMVKAIMDGRKIVTRRFADINTEVTCNSGDTDHEFVLDSFSGRPTPSGFVCRKCGFGVAPPHSRVPCGTSLFRPRYWPGDTLYVRETWTQMFYVDPDGYTHFDQPMYYYAADGTPDITLVDGDGFEEDDQRVRWKPSIHMPKEAARLFLRVVSIKLERLQDMVFADVLMEGISEDDSYESTWKRWHDLWNSTINPADLPSCGWEANPWVWVIKFERCAKPEEVPSNGK